MNGPDPNEDLMYRIAATAFAVLIAIGLVVLLSGHGNVTPPANRVSPDGATTTMGPPSTNTR